MNKGFFPKFLRIFGHEFRRHILRKRFLMALLSVPVWAVGAFALVLVSLILVTDTRPVGVIDPGGALRVLSIPGEGVVPFEPRSFERYPDETAARAALDSGAIQAYYSLPADYPASRDATLTYLEPPSAIIEGSFRRLVSYNLLLDLPEDAVKRIHEGPSLALEALDDRREGSSMQPINFAAALGLGIFLMGAVFTSGGYLMQAVAEEKENRTMEILVTSASPAQIMNGKIAALTGVGLTQLAAWALPPLGLLALAREALPQLQGLSVDRGIFTLALLTGLPTFVMAAALMAALGATVANASDGQTAIGMVSMLVMAPYYLITTITGSPNGVVAAAFTFFPLTSAQTLLIRAGVASLPPWQVALASGLVYASAAGALWLSGRAFRLGMLRYGKTVSLRELLGLAGKTGRGFWPRRLKPGPGDEPR